MIQYPDSLEATEQWRFEAKRVKMLVEYFHLGKWLRDLYDDQEREEGVRRLTLASFMRVFPTFPVMLEARHYLGLGRRLDLSTLFRRFASTFLFKDYMDRFEEKIASGERRPVGLVFNFGGYHGGMVLHNTEPMARKVRMLFDLPGDRPPHRLTIEPFNNFLFHLARIGWSPESACETRLESQRSPVNRDVAWAPWMVRRLGAGAPFVLFTWLHSVLLSESSYARLFVTCVDRGVRAVRANHKMIARETGLTFRQVKDALASLRRLGLVETRRVERGSTIFLTPPDQS